MPDVVLGIDTHSDSHVAAALDPLGRLLGALTFPANPSGHRQLLSWCSRFGTVGVAGVEGTGSYGASLSRFLEANGLTVLEVQRPSRQHRRRRGKSDPSDAEAAARSVHAGTYVGLPKSARGSVEMIRVLRVAKRSAVKARTQAMNQLRALLVTCPDELRSRLQGLPARELVAACSRLKPRGFGVTTATKLALRSLARRHLSLSAEIAELDAEISCLVADVAPELLALPGIGADTSASLLVAAGDNPERLRSESSFAHLCGVAPLPASSGKTVRHRLNRGGNRDANRALHVVVLSRMSSDERTRRYVARRTAEGKTKREILRCLKRYVAREVYGVLIWER